jgi:hypothetical protein
MAIKKMTYEQFRQGQRFVFIYPLVPEHEFDKTKRELTPQQKELARKVIEERRKRKQLSPQVERALRRMREKREG